MHNWDQFLLAPFYRQPINCDAVNSHTKMLTWLQILVSHKTLNSLPQQ